MESLKLNVRGRYIWSAAVFNNCGQIVSIPNDLFVSRLSSNKNTSISETCVKRNCFCFWERLEVALLSDLGSCAVSVEGTFLKKIVKAVGDS